MLGIGRQLAMHQVPLIGINQGRLGFITDIALCLLYTSDAADERSSVDLGGRRIIKKKTRDNVSRDQRIRPRNYLNNNRKQSTRRDMSAKS